MYAQGHLNDFAFVSLIKNLIVVITDVIEKLFWRA